MVFFDYKKLIALLASTIVPLLIFFIVITMNESDFDRDELQKSITSFEVEKKRIVQQEQKKPKPKQQRNRENLPAPKPISLIDSSLSGGLSFGLPQFDEANFAEFNDGGLLDSFSNEALDDTVVDTKPKVRKRAPIVYPELARKQGVSGFVSMNVLIDEEGNVEDVKIVESKPKEIFDLKAESTMRRWKFEPATYNGEKVRVWAQQRIVFRLN